jgi:hypothetical protein
MHSRLLTLQNHLAPKINACSPSTVIMADIPVCFRVYAAISLIDKIQLLKLTSPRTSMDVITGRDDTTRLNRATGVRLWMAGVNMRGALSDKQTGTAAGIGAGISTTGRWTGGCNVQQAVRLGISRLPTGDNQCSADQSQVTSCVLREQTVQSSGRCVLDQTSVAMFQSSHAALKERRKHPPKDIHLRSCFVFI